MYGLDRRMLGFLCVFMVVSLVVWLVFMFNIFADLTATDTPIPGLPIHVCDPVYDASFAAGYFIASLVLETVLFLLALWKSVKLTNITNRFPRWAQNATITDVLLRDTIVYFFFIFATYLIAAVFSLLGGSDINLVGEFVIAISSIMSERLLINIREHCKKDTQSTESGGFSILSLH